MSLVTKDKYSLSFAVFWFTSCLFVGLALHDFFLRPEIASIENGFQPHTVGPTGFEIAQCLVLTLGYGAFLIPLLCAFIVVESLCQRDLSLRTMFLVATNCVLVLP